MTVTVPSTDLVGCVADALNFISPDKDNVERRVVDLRWDGRLLHASATDGIRMAVSSWSPDDAPEKDVQHELGTELGGDDGPWRLLLAADDAAHLIKVAKPVKGLEYLPLTLDCDGPLLTVRRPKQARVPAFSLTYDGAEHDYPDLREVVVEAMGRAEAVKEISFNAVFLASFGDVRQRGHAAKWTFAGPDHPAVVEIGERFVGAIMPVRNGQRESEAQAA